MFFIIISIIYYSFAKGSRLNCKEFKHVVKENIAEGEDEDLAQLKRIDKNISSDFRKESSKEFKTLKNNKDARITSTPL